MATQDNQNIIALQLFGKSEENDFEIAIDKPEWMGLVELRHIFEYACRILSKNIDEGLSNHILNNLPKIEKTDEVSS